MIYFLDTNICVYFLNGSYESILRELKIRKPQTIKIPSLVKAELLYGAEKSRKKHDNIERLERFLTPFEIVSFDDSASQVYSIIRTNTELRGKRVGPNDLIIAATVMANHGILVTNNEKEFGNIQNLIIENWIKEVR